jgi:toxin ParE1/3/4
MKRVDLHRGAIADADDAFDYYAKDNLAVALEFRAELGAMLRTIGQMPTRFPAYRRGTQRAVMSGFPYSVIFRDARDRVDIIAVAHGRRSPAYWVHRLKED